jgi:hypothetical protein
VFVNKFVNIISVQPFFLCSLRERNTNLSVKVQGKGFEHEFNIIKVYTPPVGTIYVQGEGGFLQ